MGAFHHPATAHVHLQIGWRDGQWDLHVLDLEAGRSEASETSFLVARLARTRVPEGSAFGSILGSPGTPVWILPQIENPVLLFLGIGTSHIPNGLFQNNRVRLTLTKVDGPGAFALFSTGALGQPVLHMTSLDGVEPDRDWIEIPAVNGHTHVNWAFTAPGFYRVGFSASGQRSGDGLRVQSPSVDYRFAVQGPPPPRLGIPRFTPDGTPAFWLESDPEETCQLLESTDLSRWRVVTNITNPHGRREVLITTPSPDHGPQRFWKALLR